MRVLVVLRELWESEGLTQGKFAVKCNVTPAYLSAVMAQSRPFTTSFAVKVERAIDVPNYANFLMQTYYEEQLDKARQLADEREAART